MLWLYINLGSWSRDKNLSSLNGSLIASTGLWKQAALAAGSIVPIQLRSSSSNLSNLMLTQCGNGQSNLSSFLCFIRAKCTEICVPSPSPFPFRNTLYSKRPYKYTVRWFPIQVTYFLINHPLNWQYVLVNIFEEKNKQKQKNINLLHKKLVTIFRKKRCRVKWNLSFYVFR